MVSRSAALLWTRKKFGPNPKTGTHPWPAMAGHGRPCLAMAGHGWPWLVIAGLVMAGNGRTWPGMVGHVRTMTGQWSAKDPAIKHMATFSNCESKKVPNPRSYTKASKTNFPNSAIASPKESKTQLPNPRA